MKQEKKSGMSCGIFLFQPLDSRSRTLQQRIVFWHVFRERVSKISQQSEMKPRISIGKVMNLQRFDEMIDSLGSREQGWNHHQRSAIRGNARGIIQPRQQARSQEHVR